MLLNEIISYLKGNIPELEMDFKFQEIIKYKIRDVLLLDLTPFN